MMMRLLLRMTNQKRFLKSLSSGVAVVLPELGLSHSQIQTPTIPDWINCSSLGLRALFGVQWWEVVVVQSHHLLVKPNYHVP